jgi:hypothetical protein
MFDLEFSNGMDDGFKQHLEDPDFINWLREQEFEAVISQNYPPHAVDDSTRASQGDVMSNKEDHDRQSIHEDAYRSKFHDPVMRELSDIKNVGFTIPRFKVHAERLIGLGERVERQHAERLAHNPEAAMSEEEAAIVLDKKKATDLLKEIAYKNSSSPPPSS